MKALLRFCLKKSYPMILHETVKKRLEISKEALLFLIILKLIHFPLFLLSLVLQ